MRILWLISLVVFVLSCGSKNEVDFQQLDISYDGEKAVYLVNDKPFTGIAIEEYPSRLIKHHIENGFEIKELGFYPTGEKEREFLMKEGLKHGKCMLWYKDGTIQVEENYVDGHLDGLVKRYEFDGSLIEEKKYEKGQLVE